MCSVVSMAEHLWLELVLKHLRHMVHGSVEDGNFLSVTLKEIHHGRDQRPALPARLQRLAPGKF